MKQLASLSVAVLLVAGCKPLERQAVIVVDGRPYEGPVSLSEFGPCITIDKAEKAYDADEVLKTLRDLLPGDVPHDSVAEGIKNLNDCTDVTTKGLTIVGHGTEGRINVGGGTFIKKDKYIALKNETDWDSLVDNLTEGSEPLTLLSCNTGGGQRGADLLKKVADLTNRTVKGRTGFVFVNADGIYYQVNSVWNEVKPTAGAVVRERPKPPFEFFLPSVLTLGGTTFPVSDIQRTNLEVFALDGKLVPFRPSLPLLDSASTLEMIDFAHPFTPPGHPLAPPTAQIEIERKSGRPRLIVIYGDVLARDPEAHPPVYFDVDPHLTKMLQAQAYE